MILKALPQLRCNVKMDIKDFMNYICLVHDMSQQRQRQRAAVNTNKTPGSIKIAIESSDWRREY
jgi:hypothetical protein